MFEHHEHGIAVNDSACSSCHCRNHWKKPRGSSDAVQCEQVQNTEDDGADLIKQREDEHSVHYGQYPSMNALVFCFELFKGSDFGKIQEQSGDVPEEVECHIGRGPNRYHRGVGVDGNIQSLR